MLGQHNTFISQFLFSEEDIPPKHQFRSFYAITNAVCEIKPILIFIPLHVGTFICQFLFREEDIPLKHLFWSFLAIMNAVSQIQMILLFIGALMVSELCGQTNFTTIRSLKFNPYSFLNL